MYMTLDVQVLFGNCSLVQVPTSLPRTKAYRMVACSPVTQSTLLNMATSIKAAKGFQQNR